MKILSVILSGLSFLIFIGCNEDPTSNDDTLNVEPQLNEFAAFGWEVNDIVGTGSDIQDLTAGGVSSVNVETSGLIGAANLKTLAKEMQIRGITYMQESFSLKKPQTDSLYYFFDDTVHGVRKALYFDEATSMARYYEVRYKFAGWRTMTYDSAEIAVNLNFTLDYSRDDYLDHVVRLQLFKDYFMIQKIHSALMVTDHSGQDITGFEASIDSYYHETRRLAHMRQSIKINPDQSGTLREDFDFKDGTTAYNTVTFYPNYTGTFSRMFRDGTIISGSFNSIEDDLSGSFSETIDFPDGRYIDKIIKEAIVSLILPDSILNASFTKSVHFSNGTIRTANIDLTAQNESGVGLLDVEISKGNGAHGNFLIQVTDTDAGLEGNWTTANGDYYILISAEYYADGSAHLSYRVFQTPYTPGDDPILVADYYFSPDGQGEGTLVYQGENYMISFDSHDTAEIRSGDKSRRINLYLE